MDDPKTLRLGDMLATMDPAREIKIGAENGSSYFYAGTVADIIENGPLYSRKLLNYAKLLSTNASADLEQTLRNPPTLQRYALIQIKAQSPDYTYDGFKAMASIWLKTVRKRIENKTRRERQYREYVDLFSRTVHKSFDADAIAGEDATVIIVEGFEYGQYWTTGDANGHCSLGLSMYNGQDFDEDSEVTDIN